MSNDFRKIVSVLLLFTLIAGLVCYQPGTLRQAPNNSGETDLFFYSESDFSLHDINLLEERIKLAVGFHDIYYPRIISNNLNQIIIYRPSEIFRNYTCLIRHKTFFTTRFTSQA